MKGSKAINSLCVAPGTYPLLWDGIFHFVVAQDSLRMVILYQLIDNLIHWPKIMNHWLEMHTSPANLYIHPWVKISSFPMPLQ